MLPELNLIQLDNRSILQQLQLEEALLRTDTKNWCIIQHGVDPAIVMGISGRIEEQVHVNLLQQAPVPVIKRFSGGGTVFVDANTTFVTFICNASDVEVTPRPDDVFCWSDSIYRDVFLEHPYKLVERDYTFEGRKFGGNAQYMRRDRWLHHTTFLWDYSSEMMNYLPLPKRRPEYRQSRSHEEFLCRLVDYFPSVSAMQSRLEEALEKRFLIKRVSVPKVDKEHRRSTVVVQ